MGKRCRGVRLLDSCSAGGFDCEGPGVCGRSGVWVWIFPETIHVRFYVGEKGQNILMSWNEGENNEGINTEKTRKVKLCWHLSLFFL